MVTTCTLLALSVLALWFGAAPDSSLWRRHAWLVLLASACAAGAITGIVQPAGLVAVAVFAVAGWWYYRKTQPGWGRGLVAVALLGFAVALMLHRVPGFSNPKVMDAVRLTADARPFTLYLNLDKTLVGLVLVGWGLRRIGNEAEWRAMLRVVLPAALVLAVVLMVLSLAAGYVRWAPKFPDGAWLWLGVNLGFVCLAEEALFRGFILTELQRALGRLRHGAWLALGVSAGLFGLAHAAGGATYVALATVAGLGYGWVYQRTGRIEAAMLVHWGVNTVHFFGFTYPALA